MMKLMRCFCLSVLSLAAAGIVTAGAQAMADTGAEPDRYVHIELVPERTTIGPGETVAVGIEQNIYEGWHTYWINPGDSGAPAELDWDMPEGFTAGPVSWPVPVKVATGPLTSYGYKDRAVMVQTITAPDDLPDGPVALRVDIELLVCDDICIPEYSSHSLIFNEGSAEDHQSAAFIGAAFIADARDHMPADFAGSAVYAAEGGAQGQGSFVVEIDFAEQDDLSLATLAGPYDVFPHEWGIVDAGADSEALADEERGALLLRTARSDRDLLSLGALDVLVTYRDDTGARHGFTVTAQPDPQWQEAASAMGAVHPENEGGAPLLPESLQISLLTALAFALFGGIVLNLMPCVFPVLSLKALSLCKLSGEEESKARMQGLFYTAGILFSFALMALILIAFKAGGAQIGWGFHLQNPAVVLLLAYLLFTIGLSLSGLFEISGRFTGAGAKLTAREGRAGSFFTGILAALVATPCTAPFMGVAMGYALVQPAAVSMAVFLMLGFGLALPYLLLSFVPALRTRMPRPGPWMITFKEFLAFPMYASAAWLVWVYSQQAGTMGVLYALGGLVSIGFAIWLYRQAPKKDDGEGGTVSTGGLFMRGVAIILLVLALAVAFIIPPSPAGHKAVSEAAEGRFGQSYSPERYQALLDGDEPVFVNMTAAWCITCKVNERVALDISETRALFAAHDVAYLVGDWTNADPEITKFLERYGRNGVPIYVYHGPRDPESGARPEAAVLPQLLTPAIIRNAVAGRAG